MQQAYLLIHLTGFLFMHFLHSGPKHTSRATFIHLQLNTTQFSSNDPISETEYVLCVQHQSFLSRTLWEPQVRACL